MLKTAIVEDDESYREELSSYVKRYAAESGQDIQIFIYGDGSAILKEYEPKYDIILLDIEMPKINGMETARRIRAVDPGVVLVFITNMASYAIHGYEVGALDFITKPVTWFTFQLRFRRAVERAAMRKDEEILLAGRDGVEKIQVRDIYYVEVPLFPHHFAKCNHWYIVNLAHVKRITKDTVIVGDMELEMSRRARAGFLDALTAYMGGGYG